jgi:hypothetical protein
MEAQQELSVVGLASMTTCILLNVHSVTVKPALVTTCIQGPPLFIDHLVLSQKAVPYISTSIKIPPPFFLGPDVVA